MIHVGVESISLGKQSHITLRCDVMTSRDITVWRHGVFQQYWWRTCVTSSCNTCNTCSKVFQARILAKRARRGRGRQCSGVFILFHFTSVKFDYSICMSKCLGIITRKHFCKITLHTNMSKLQSKSCQIKASYILLYIFWKLTLVCIDANRKLIKGNHPEREHVAF